MLFPILWVEGEIRQKINGRLEYKQASISAQVVEAVSGIAALYVLPECLSSAVGAPLVSMARSAGFILAYKHHVVVRFIFVEHPCPGEVCDHIPVNMTVLHQVGVYSAHIPVGGRQHKLFGR